MKFFFFLFASFFIQTSSSAQRFTTAETAFLNKKQDTLQDLSDKIVSGINAADRLKADSIFTKVLVRALKTNHSFNFNFDSLMSVSRLYSPDSTFKVFTWHLVINDNVIRQHGAIQMKTADGSLKLFPLIDKSDITTNIADTIGDHSSWMGAVYYRIINTTHQGRKFYTLLGYDENNIRSNKKIIEILTFENGRPVFGARQFSIASGYGYNNKMARFVMEYKKQASPRLTFDADLNMIIFEHLVSESNQPNKKWTLVGDGDYEGFKWTDGKWVYVNKVFTEVTAEGKEPVPMPLRDEKGLLDETKLKGNEPVPPAPIKPKPKKGN